MKASTFWARRAKKTALAWLSFCFCMCVLVCILFFLSLINILAFWSVTSEFTKAVGVSRDKEFLQFLCRQEVWLQKKNPACALTGGKLSQTYWVSEVLQNSGDASFPQRTSWTTDGFATGLVYVVVLISGLQFFLSEFKHWSTNNPRVWTPQN